MQHDTRIELILLPYHTEHHFNVVSVVLVLRITAQRLVKIRLIRIVKPLQIVVPRTVSGRKAGKQAFSQIAEIVSGTVTPRVGIIEAVTELQKCSTP